MSDPGAYVYVDLDLNPVPIDVRPRVLATAITADGDATASMANVFAVAGLFGITAADARAIARKVGKVVAGWRKTAAALGVSRREVGRMSSAFEHDDLDSVLT